MQRLYGHRRTTLLDGLRNRFGNRITILPSAAGLHFSFRLTGPVDWEKALQRASERNVAFERCSRYAMISQPLSGCAIGFGLLKDNQASSTVDRLVAIFE